MENAETERDCRKALTTAVDNLFSLLQQNQVLQARLLDEIHFANQLKRARYEWEERKFQLKQQKYN